MASAKFAANLLTAQVYASMLIGVGRARPISLRVQGRTSQGTQLGLNYDAPEPKRARPALTPTFGGRLVTVVGTGFGCGGVMISLSLSLSLSHSLSHTHSHFEMTSHFKMTNTNAPPQTRACQQGR